MNDDESDPDAADSGPKPDRPLPPNPRRLPRWAAWVLILGAILVAAFVLRIVIALGVAYAYYGSTPDFASFVAERATPPERVFAWLPTGAVLARDEAWHLGQVAAEDLDELGVDVAIEIRHGDELLLATTVSFDAVVDRATWERRGFAIPVPEIQTRDGMHAIVQVSLLGVGRSLGEAGQGRLFVDAVLAAGAGDNTFRVVELEAPPPSWPSTNPIPAAFRLLLGLLHPPGPPPEEGLLHQAHAGFFLSWRKTEGGAQGVGTEPSAMRTNDLAYSFRTTVTSDYRDAGRSSGSRKDTWSRTYTWNDRIW